MDKETHPMSESRHVLDSSWFNGAAVQAAQSLLADGKSIYIFFQGQLWLSLSTRLVSLGSRLWASFNLASCVSSPWKEATWEICSH